MAEPVIVAAWTVTTPVVLVSRVAISAASIEVSVTVTASLPNPETVVDA